MGKVKAVLEDVWEQFPEELVDHPFTFVKDEFTFMEYFVHFNGTVIGSVHLIFYGNMRFSYRFIGTGLGLRPIWKRITLKSFHKSICSYMWREE